MVEAFAMVRAGTTRAISLHLAGAADFGHEDYLDELRTRISSSGLDDSVTLEGRVEDVNSFLDTMDICVQYSTRPEPLGQNVLQYLARGVAVLVAAEGGPLEWVTDGKNGILVQPRSAGALSNALLGLIENDDKRRALASNAVDTPGLLSDEEVAEGSARFLEEFMGLEGAET
ncbi:hypothetical protein ASG04_09840 [Curtobacterium sp. Leaf183]|nr:hypothetical protein ASG04_09840 [Curtobacterium sp. Leaf183]